MMVSGMMVDRWLWSALQDMKENNLTEVYVCVEDAKEEFGLTPTTMVMSKRTCL